MKNIFKSLAYSLNNKQKTVFIVGGGEVHDTIPAYIKWVELLDITQPRTSDWKQWLAQTLPWSGYKVVRLQMPDKTNAYYEAWRAMYEKYTIRQKDIVVGHSLGASFLYNYYQNYDKTPQLHLVAIAKLNRDDWEVKPYNNDYHFYHSQDDAICPIKTVQPYLEKTHGQVRIFEDRGHFLQPTFVELLKNIT